MRKKTIVQKHKANFQTLEKAFLSGDVCLLDCIEKATKKHVAVICAVNKGKDGGIETVPFAKFFNGNPYKLLIPPM